MAVRVFPAIIQQAWSGFTHRTFCRGVKATSTTQPSYPAEYLSRTDDEEFAGMIEVPEWRKAPSTARIVVSGNARVFGATQRNKSASG